MLRRNGLRSWVDLQRGAVGYLLQVENPSRELLGDYVGRLDVEALVEALEAVDKSLVIETPPTRTLLLEMPCELAVGEGFEPPVHFRARRFSRPVR